MPNRYSYNLHIIISNNTLIFILLYIYKYIYIYNIDKNNILLFNIRNINDNIKLKLKIDNKEICNVEKIKCMGIIIDNRLDWKRQIHYL